MEELLSPISSTARSFLSTGKAFSLSDNDYASSNSSSLYAESDESSNVNFHLGPRRDALYVVLPITIIYLSIFITGTIGNVTTCIVIARNKSMHTATNYYLFSLAVSDLLLLISGLPIEVYLVWSKYPYIFGEHFCRLRGLAAECSTNASVLTITAFTVERYVAICHPFLSHTMSKLTRAIKFILIIWLLALSFAIPLAMQFGIIDYREKNPNYVLCMLKVTLVEHSFEISTLLFFVVPMILITVLYVMIGLKLRKSNMMKHDNGENRTLERATTATTVGVNNGRKDQRNCRHHTGRSSRRVLKMLVAVVVAFFICWAPFHVQRLIAIYGTDDDHVMSKSKWIEFLYLLSTYVSGVLYYVSATINPILYNIMSNKFREAFMETLARTCGRTDLISQEQRSYSSFSRSQQQRGGTGASYGSRNATTGCVAARDSTDCAVNPRKENGLDQSRIPDYPETNDDPQRRSFRRPNEARLVRSLSRKSNVNTDSQIRNGSSVRPLLGTSRNSQTRESTPENSSDGTRGWRHDSDASTNLFVAARNDRFNDGDKNERLIGHRRKYVPVIGTDGTVVRRKKWWRFFKWLPNAKAFGLSNNGTRYTSPSHSTINDIENNREAYSMTSCYTEARNERPV